jgi:mannonate dehydratase
MLKNSNGYPMIQSMRWYGPDDPVTLNDIKQAGCTAVVTSLDQFAPGETWTANEVLKRKKQVEAAGLRWEVVESIPVHEAIKARKGAFLQYIENYKTSMINLALHGINVITYNFMPVLNWTRTNLEFVVADGSKALQFEWKAFAAFDLHILKRPNAAADYTADQLLDAANYFLGLSDQQKLLLRDNIIAGLPGYQQKFSLQEFQSAIDFYQGISSDELRSNLVSFLQEIVPVAEKYNINLAIHPDDPPFSLLGLPRVVSTADDIAYILNAVQSSANGLCFCTGSYGVRADNNIPDMIRRFGSHIYFFHLRNTTRNSSGDFFEDNHLEGDTNMYDVVKEIISLSDRQKRNITLRPDHGHQMLDDLAKKTNPGYSAIGRLRGLAELRGLEYGLRGGLV